MLIRFFLENKLSLSFLIKLFLSSSFNSKYSFEYDNNIEWKNEFSLITPVLVKFVSSSVNGDKKITDLSFSKISSFLFIFFLYIFFFLNNNYLL